MSVFLNAECPYMSVNVRHVRLKCPALNEPVIAINYRLEAINYDHRS